MDQEPPVTPAPGNTPPGVAQRRGFLVKSVSIIIGGFLGLFPFAVGLVAFFDPLRRKSDAGRFVRIAPLSAVPTDGVPRRFTVLADRTDAWNRFPNEPIGAVYLRRTGNGEIEALNSTCPHAGCFVDFKQQSQCFKCPCHNSEFTPAGAIIQPSPSPRAMDTLNVQLRNQGGSQDVWVQFENFYTGISEKLPKA